MRTFSLVALAFISLALPSETAGAQDVAAPTGPQSGQKIVFLGHSITQYAVPPAGYVALVDEAFKHVGRPLTVINAGISGDTSTMMLARLKTDVLDKKPDWMTLSCGVNDVWGRSPGGVVPLDTFKTNVTSIVDQATAAGIKVVILTCTKLGENENDFQNNPEDGNQKRIAYNDFLRDLAKQRTLPLADLATDETNKIIEYHKRWPHSRLSYLTHDGVHMNGAGNIMMATGVLKALGFTDAQIEKENAGWVDLGGVGLPLGGVELTVRQSEQVHDLAEKAGLTAEEYLTKEVQRAMPMILSQPPAPVPTK